MAAKLLFDDEFDSFDPYSKTDHWKTSYHWGANTPINGEKAYYVDTENDGQGGPASGANPFTASNGTLAISAAPARTALPTGQPYTSGAITTEGHFEHQYGYYEVRAELSGGQGFWPAFWLLPADNSNGAELDIMEFSSRLPNEYATTAHTKASGVPETLQQFNKNLPDLSKGFHTFAVDWQADKVTWFVDHQAVYAVDTPEDFHQPMHILLNLAAGGGGDWVGNPDGSIQHYQIDHVRVYDHNPDLDSAAAANDAYHPLDAVHGA